MEDRRIEETSKSSKKSALLRLTAEDPLLGEGGTEAAIAAAWEAAENIVGVMWR